MEGFEKFNNLYRLLVATMVAAVSTLVLGRLERVIKERSLMWLVFFASIAAVLFILSELFETVFEKSILLRRLVVGADFIEGDWFDFSIDWNRRIVPHGTVLTICWKDRRFQISGVKFDCKGNKVCTFKSTGAAYIDRTLTFGYVAHNHLESQEIEYGVDQLQFENPPVAFSGSYMDTTGAVHFRVQGVKVKREQARRHDDFRDPDSKMNFILEQIQLRQQTLTQRESGSE